MLHRTLSLLASPLDAPSLPVWREQVLRSVQPLFGADGGGFILPHEGADPFSIVDRPRAYLDTYLAYQALDITLEPWKDLGYGAASGQSLFAGNPRDLHRSDIYSLVFQPYRIENALLCIVDLTDRPPCLGNGTVFAPRGVPLTGMLALWSDDWERNRFGDWGLKLMWLLQPLLKSAGQSWGSLASRREGLVRLVDESSDGLALFDTAGECMHRNRALDRILAEEPNRAPLEAGITRAARALTRLLGRDGRLQHAQAAFEREVDTGAHRYLLRATRGEEMVGRRGAIIIMVQPMRTRVPSATQLGHRFGLTRRESDVALLLAHGASNKRVAAELAVTEFTARRHTERVLRKLRVNSRSQVAARLHAQDTARLDEG